jgi:hypothetical protein
MVLKGQYLERPAVIEVDELWLEGLYHRGDLRPSLLVCPPLALGPAMDAPPVAELAFAAAKSGRPSLRFQHRGVGASQGERDPSKALEDARAAHRHLAECDGPRIAVAAYLDGARTALALAAEQRHPPKVVLISPPPPGSLPPIAGLEVLVMLPEGAAPERVEPWRALAESGAVELRQIGGPDDRYLRGLVQIGHAAIEWLGGGGGELEILR